MKKYEKPVVIIENFMFAQTIAQGCSDSIVTDHLTWGSASAGCKYDLGGTSAFVESIACDVNGEELGLGCYNNPGGGNAIFRS